MDNFVIFPSIILFTKYDIVSDCIINNPRFLSHQTHTTINRHLWSGLVCWEFHLSEKRIY